MCLRMDSWQILGIKQGSDEATIKSAFRKRALKVHPDVGGCAEEFKKLYKAFEECLHAVEPEIEINLDEVFSDWPHLTKIFKAMNINAFASGFGLDSLIGMKVHFTFDGRHTHEHVERNELEGTGNEGK